MTKFFYIINITLVTITISTNTHQTPQWNGVSFPETSSLKGVSSIANISTPKAFPVTDATLPRPHYRIGNINELGSTPKGLNLDNHWGTSPQLNIYGPKGDPKLLNVYPWAATTFNEMFTNRYMTISKNYATKGGEIDPLADAPRLRRKLMADNLSCIIELKRNYPFCSMYNGNCQMCASNDVCVYNYQTKKCLPGDNNGDLCKSSPHFYRGVYQCNNSLASNTLFGNVDNLGGKAVKSIKAQTRNKLGATGDWWNYIDEAGKTRVVSGQFSNLSSDDYNVREPIYVDNVGNGTPIPPNWKPTLNPTYDVVSGHVGSLAKDARSLINPGIPNVLVKPPNDAYIVKQFELK